VQISENKRGWVQTSENKGFGLVEAGPLMIIEVSGEAPGYLLLFTFHFMRRVKGVGSKVSRMFGLWTM